MTEAPGFQPPSAEWQPTFEVNSPHRVDWLTEPTVVPVSVDFGEVIGEATVHPDGTVKGVITDHVTYQRIVFGGDRALRGFSLKRDVFSVDTDDHFGVRIVQDDDTNA